VSVPLNVIQRQLGHANLGTTSIYLQGIDTEEIIATVHARRAPMMSATAGLQLQPTRKRREAHRALPPVLSETTAPRPRASTTKVSMPSHRRASASSNASVATAQHARLLLHK
jgi:hypothetical protein